MKSKHALGFLVFKFYMSTSLKERATTTTTIEITLSKESTPKALKLPKPETIG
jgi:hypothetical protein